MHYYPRVSMDRAPAFVIGGIALLLFVAGIFPLRFWDGFLLDDAVAHFLSGIAIALAAVGWYPERDDVLFGATAFLGVLWEVPEAIYFRCDPLTLGCTDSVLAWFIRDDTIADIALVALGAVLVLIVTNRYR